MTRIIVRVLIIDKYNLEHIKKHKINESEVIEAGKNIVYHRRTYKERYLATARSGSRIITLIIRREAIGRYYLITARDADKKERMKLYEKEKKQNS